MQNTWHTPKKIFIAVEVIAKNSRYLDLPAPIVLVYASSRAAAVYACKNFSISSCTTAETAPNLPIALIPDFPLPLFFF